MSSRDSEAIASAHHGTINVEDVPDVCCESERLLLCVLRLDFLAKGGRQVSKRTQDSAFSSSTCPKRLTMESAGLLTPSTTMPELSLASIRSCRNARSGCEMLRGASSSVRSVTQVTDDGEMSLET